MNSELWAGHFHPGRAGYIHPRYWEHAILPLTELPADEQVRIREAAQQDEPPGARLVAELHRAPSRAWYEWHWTRGLKLRQDPAYLRPPRRRWIRPSLRQAVYERDGYRCLHCGTSERLSLDHIHPFSMGGDDTLENLQTLCQPCNSRKGARV